MGCASSKTLKIIEEKNINLENELKRIRELKFLRDKEINQLTIKIGEINQEKIYKQNENEILRNKISLLLNDLQNEKDNKNNLLSIVEDKKYTIKNLEYQKNELIQQKKDHNKTINSLKDKRKSLEDKVKNMENKIMSKENQLENLMEQLETKFRN